MSIHAIVLYLLACAALGWLLSFLDRDLVALYLLACVVLGLLLTLADKDQNDDEDGLS